jgi:CRP-like cAMP-binding protein
MSTEPDFWEVTWQFDGQAFEPLRSMGEELTYAAQATVFKQGDGPDGMYLVLSGYALVVTVDKDTGIEHTVGIVAQGQSFGELGLLIEQPRLATVVAGTELRVLKITPEILERIEQNAPQSAVILYKKLARTIAEQLVARGDLVGSEGKS